MVQVNEVSVLGTMLLLWCEATINPVSHTFIIILIYTKYDNASSPLQISPSASSQL